MSTRKGDHRGRPLVLLATLDIKNAFNSVRWNDILRALRFFRLPEYLVRVLEDYLRDRKLLYEIVDGQTIQDITAGVTQGSILGPLLRNLTYDGLLRLRMPEDTSLEVYADYY